MSLFFTQPALLLLLLLLPAIYVVGTRDRLRTRRLWVITGLRLAAVASLVLSLAGPTLVTPRRDLAVVFLVDVSDSLGAGGKQSAYDFVRQAYEGAGGRDRVGLIVFGKEPRVERDVAAATPLGDLLSRPDATATDIPSAIRLALALFPDGAQKRIVLVSDGANNVGDLEDAGRLAASAGVQIQTRTLGGERGADVVVDSVQAPLRVRAGESFELQVGVDSSIAATGRLEVFGDGRLIAQREVQVKSGRNEYIVAVPEQARGFHRWQARVLVGGDTVAQNNQAEGFTYVEAPPRVLVAEAEADEGRNLHAALRATGLDAVLMNASNIPASLTALSEYSAVVLVDVPLTALPDEGRMLQTYVRDLGKGLITVGGEESYALGGYFNSPLEATLPVDSRLKNKQNEPLVAMVMALDKSGSMASCHCGGGDEFQDPPGSIPKVDTAKEATIQSAQLLGPEDEFGVVAFDNAARWVVRTAPIGDGTAAAEQVAGIQAAGGTNIYGGLAEAVESLKSSKASVKHVVLLTDGWSNVGNYDKLIADARASGITISTIAAGGGSPELLKSIAEKGAGAFYVSKNNADIPKILLRETQRKLRRYIQEVEFTPTITAPSPVLKDLHAVHSLLGYVGTTAKPGATVALSSPEREPVLAQWQYGLGRSASWTSDAKSRWSANWISTPEYARLWSQAVGWVLARPSENVQVSVTQESGRAVVEVDALRPNGAYLNGADAKVSVVSPSGKVTEQPLEQTAPGRYAGELPASEEGSYIASASLGTAGGLLQAPTTGYAVGYSPEYRSPGPNKPAMNRLASLTGGKEIAAPAEAFARDLPPARAARSLWRLFALLGLLLMLAEVAVRRLSTRWSAPASLNPALVVSRRRTDAMATAPAADARPQPSPAAPAANPAAARTPEVEPVGEPDEPPAPAPEVDEEDSFSRLRSAKRRAARR